MCRCGASGLPRTCARLRCPCFKRPEQANDPQRVLLGAGPHDRRFSRRDGRRLLFRNLHSAFITLHSALCTLHLQNSPIVHPRDPVGEAEDPLVVGHDDQCPPGADGDLAEQGHHPLAGVVVEGAGRLIADDQVGAVDQRCGRWPPAAVGRRTAAWAATLGARSARPTRRKRVLGRRPWRPAGLDAVDQQRDRHVLGRRQRRQEVERLEDEADVLAPARPCGARSPMAGQVVAEDAAGLQLVVGRATAVGVEDAGDDADERRLAAPAGADEHEQLARVRRPGRRRGGPSCGCRRLSYVLVTPRHRTAAAGDGDVGLDGVQWHRNGRWLSRAFRYPTAEWRPNREPQMHTDRSPHPLNTTAGSRRTMRIRLSAAAAHAAEPGWQPRRRRGRARSCGRPGRCAARAGRPTHAPTRPMP